jgi:hypothetical protein
MSNALPHAAGSVVFEFERRSNDVSDLERAWISGSAFLAGMRFDHGVALGRTNVRAQRMAEVYCFPAAGIALLYAGDGLKRKTGYKHSFFFIDMEVWGLLSFVLGIVLWMKG